MFPNKSKEVSAAYSAGKDAWKAMETTPFNFEEHNEIFTAHAAEKALNIIDHYLSERSNLASLIDMSLFADVDQHFRLLNQQSPENPSGEETEQIMRRVKRRLRQLLPERLTLIAATGGPRITVDAVLELIVIYTRLSKTGKTACLRIRGRDEKPENNC